MSDQEEEFNIENTVEPEEHEEVIDTVNIPAPSEERSELDISEEHESELELSEQSDISILSLELNEERRRLEEAVSPRKSLPVSGYSPQANVEFTQQDSNEEALAFLNKIKAMKESLQTSVRESSATVRVVLIPVGQEIIMPFKVDTIFKHLKDHFSHLLHIPPSVLQISYKGIIFKNNETLIQHGVKPQEIIQLELFSTNPDQYPIKRIEGLNDVSQILTVTVQIGINQYQVVTVEIIKSDFHKPFLGGFKHKITGIEYHNAGTQTVPKYIRGKKQAFSRDTQTVSQRKKLQQTTNTTSTQMSKIGVYVSNITDKLLKPGDYFSAAKYHARRFNAAIVIQTRYRQWHAKVFVRELKEQKKLRLEWEAQEELRKIKEKEEWTQLDYHRRHNPKTNEDFELLYNALNFWHQEELSRINQCLTGAERKAALCELLEKETQIIASIGRHRSIAYLEREESEKQVFLNKCSAPKIWRRSDGKTVEMDTQFTIRARELQNIYKCITLRNLSQDERVDILLTLKHTVKVPQDPLKFYKKIYFCRNCQLYLPSTEFAISSTSKHIYRCRHCTNLQNEAKQREAFLKYKCLLQRLYSSEADYEDDSQIAFLMQLQDIQYLMENIWASQSVLSAWDDINDLVLVRWDKNLEWSPWNCILLTKDEAVAHLKLTSIEEEYGQVFIHKIKHKHILAKNYFSQIPALASYILDHGEFNEIRKKYYTDTSPKIIKVNGPHS
ncbi:IQ and ubiquitin-like domain-containing protein isoform X3 [Marmota marmota marmota]|uniref:IQ and ubiquitin-like domain-containing protein isoform X3 n=1 Tax=Marmota marmota marmota TaxID=9994 RepID=UPI002093F82A|nr:IQ and ubiquitin-like domain-containing protein isoform X3 [Marmota marmota marmota]